MSIPFLALAIGYGIGLLLYSLFMFFNIYHLVRFGLTDIVIKAHIVIMIAITIIVVIFSGLLVIEVDWTSSFTVFDLDQFSNGTNY